MPLCRCAYTYLHQPSCRSPVERRPRRRPLPLRPRQAALPHRAASAGGGHACGCVLPDWLFGMAKMLQLQSIEAGMAVTRAVCLCSSPASERPPARHRHEQGAVASLLVFLQCCHASCAWRVRSSSPACLLPSCPCCCAAGPAARQHISRHPSPNQPTTSHTRPTSPPPLL